MTKQELTDLLTAQIKKYIWDDPEITKRASPRNLPPWFYTVYISNTLSKEGALSYINRDLTSYAICIKLPGLEYRNELFYYTFKIEEQDLYYKVTFEIQP